MVSSRGGRFLKKTTLKVVSEASWWSFLKQKRPYTFAKTTFTGRRVVGWRSSGLQATQQILNSGPVHSLPWLGASCVFDSRTGSGCEWRLRLAITS